MFYVSNIDGAQVPYDAEAYRELKVSPTLDSPAVQPPKGAAHTSVSNIANNYTAVSAAASSVAKSSENPASLSHTAAPESEARHYLQLEQVQSAHKVRKDPKKERRSSSREKEHAAEEYRRHEGEVRERQPVLTAEQIMSSPVFTLEPQQSMSQARKVILHRRFRHLPILNSERKIVGIISDRDFIAIREEANVADKPEKTVSAAMKTHVLTARPSTEIRDIARVMFEERIGAMPIVEENGKLVGIITRSDILRAIVNRAPFELWT